jgi:hypothetical protein
MGKVSPSKLKIKKKAKPKKFAEGGLAPYGIRHSGEGVKGKGYFGKINMPNGKIMTEFSSQDDEIGEYPLVVPTLTKSELESLTKGKVTKAIREKARKHAKQRIKEGKSTFSSPTELRYPLPKDGYEFAKGGAVKKKTTSKVNQAGNYTKPSMRKALFESIKAGGKGGAPGQWSARKAQMLAKQYKAKGGGYKS